MNHVICTEVDITEGGCKGDNCDEPICDGCGDDWPCEGIRLEALEAEVVNLSEELVLAKAAIKRVRDLRAETRFAVFGYDMISLTDVIRALDGPND